MSEPEALDLVTLTADLVSAHLANNEVPQGQVPDLIRAVHDALATLGTAPEPKAEVAKPVAAVTARKSLADPTRIISMIDGKPYATLKRHIGRHGYTAQSYREAFGLPDSYPMVSPEYSERRRSMAKTIGLGRKAQAAAAVPAKTASEDAERASSAAGKSRRKLKAAFSDRPA